MISVNVSKLMNGEITVTGKRRDKVNFKPNHEVKSQRKFGYFKTTSKFVTH